MESDKKIRAERPEDRGAIAELTRDAFRSHPHSSQTEHLIIDALRRSGALVVSLVAVDANEQILGHIAFSPVEISDGSKGWYGLGPVAVGPAFQGQGIGSALIERGLESLRQRGAHGCVLLGEPEFYRRFGFRSRVELSLDGAPQEYFLSLPLGAEIARGEVTYDRAFAAEG